MSPFAEIVPYLVGMAVLIVLSAFFAGSETAFFSLPRASRERLSRSEKSLDRYVANMVSDPKRLITTLLLGNEFINIAFASLSTAATHHMFAHLDPLYITFIATGITVPFLLFLGEIVPKTVALATSEPWSKVAARPLGLFMFLTTPLRLGVTWLASSLVRLFGLKTDVRPHKLGEAELKALVDVGSQVGELEAAERRLIHNVFEFGDKTVAEVMTPSRDVFSLSFELPMPRVIAEVAGRGFSRVPVHRGKKADRQEIVGVLFAKDLVGWSTGRLAGKTVKDLIRPPTYVPKTSKAAQVFQEFRRTRNHFAIVVDEYGRQVGLITMEDLLRELFGALGAEPHERAPVPAQVVDVPSAPLRAPPPVDPDGGNLS